MKRIIIAFCMTLVAFAAGSLAASAHAQLDHCAPVPGTAVASAPAQVRCWFTEEIDSKQSTLVVADANGARVDNNDGQLDLNDPDHKQMVATLKPLANGVYKVTWHTVTPDDNGVSDGIWYFGVGQVTVPTFAPPAAEPTGGATTPPATTAATAAPTAAPAVAPTLAPTAAVTSTSALVVSTIPAPPGPTPAIPAAPAAPSSSTPVVIAGVLEALAILGVLVYLYRQV